MPVATACPAVTRKEPHHGQPIAVPSSHAPPHASHPLSWLPPTKSTFVIRLCLPTQFAPSKTSTTTSELSPSSWLVAVAAVTVVCAPSASSSMLIEAGDSVISCETEHTKESERHFAHRQNATTTLPSHSNSQCPIFTLPHPSSTRAHDSSFLPLPRLPGSQPDCSHAKLGSCRSHRRLAAAPRTNLLSYMLYLLTVLVE